VTTRVTNADLYGVLMDLKEDIGALKTSCTLQLDGLKNHAERLAKVENTQATQRGAVKVWGVVATAVATSVGAAVQFFRH
jgi:hypothetical protein